MTGSQRVGSSGVGTGTPRRDTLSVSDPLGNAPLVLSARVLGPSARWLPGWRLGATGLVDVPVTPPETAMPTFATRPVPVVSRPAPMMWRRVAVGSSLAIALVYGLIYLGVVSIGRAEAGDLGVLGVAALVHLAFAGLLTWTSSRLVWAGIALFQLMLAAMYLGIAADRDPAYEVWGVTIRALSAVLVVALVALIVEKFPHRDAP